MDERKGTYFEDLCGISVVAHHWLIDQRGETERRYTSREVAKWVLEHRRGIDFMMCSYISIFPLWFKGPKCKVKQVKKELYKEEYQRWKVLL